MRLHHWGSWIAYEDQENSSTYYYNHHTNKGQWDVPDKIRQKQHAASSDTITTSEKVCIYILCIYIIYMYIYINYIYHF